MKKALKVVISVSLVVAVVFTGAYFLFYSEPYITAKNTLSTNTEADSNYTKFINSFNTTFLTESDLTYELSFFNNFNFVLNFTKNRIALLPEFSKAEALEIINNSKTVFSVQPLHNKIEVYNTYKSSASYNPSEAALLRGILKQDLKTYFSSIVAFQNNLVKVIKTNYYRNSADLISTLIFSIKAGNDTVYEQCILNSTNSNSYKNSIVNVCDRLKQKATTLGNSAYFNNPLGIDESEINSFLLNAKNINLKLLLQKNTSYLLSLNNNLVIDLLYFYEVNLGIGSLPVIA